MHRSIACLLIFLSSLAHGSSAPEWSLDLNAQGGWDLGRRVLIDSSGRISIFSSHLSFEHPCSALLPEEEVENIHQNVIRMLGDKLPPISERSPSEMACSDETNYYYALAVRGKIEQQEFFSAGQMCASPDIPAYWFEFFSNLVERAEVLHENCEL